MLTDQIESRKNHRLDIRAAGRLGAESYQGRFASVARMTGREQRYGRIKHQY